MTEIAEKLTDLETALDEAQDALNEAAAEFEAAAETIVVEVTPEVQARIDYENLEGAKRGLQKAADPFENGKRTEARVAGAGFRANRERLDAKLQAMGIYIPGLGKKA